jgi:hypothetical protein
VWYRQFYAPPGREVNYESSERNYQEWLKKLKGVGMEGRCVPALGAPVVPDWPGCAPFHLLQVRQRVATVELQGGALQDVGARR